MTKELEEVGRIPLEKIRWLHDEFLLKEFQWAGPHISHKDSNFYATLYVGNLQEPEVFKWLLQSPLAKFEFIVVINNVREDGPVYKTSPAFQNLFQAIQGTKGLGIAGGFIFGVTKSRKGQFRVVINWVAEIDGCSHISIFRYGR